VVLRGLRGEAGSTGTGSWITTNDLARYVKADMTRRGVHTPVESSEGVTEAIRLVSHADAGPEKRPAMRARSRDAGDDDTFDADRWRRLTQYYISCMDRAAALAAFLDVADRGAYQPLPGGPEPALTR
jgi:hypothetical protein